MCWGVLFTRNNPTVENLNTKIVVKNLAGTIKNKFDQCGVSTMDIFLYKKVIVACEQSEHVEWFHVNEESGQIFQLDKNLSGAVWTKHHWHNKNNQDWKFCVTMCKATVMGKKL